MLSMGVFVDLCCLQVFGNVDYAVYTACLKTEEVGWGRWWEVGED